MHPDKLAGLSDPPRPISVATRLLGALTPVDDNLAASLFCSFDLNPCAEHFSRVNIVSAKAH